MRKRSTQTPGPWRVVEDEDATYPCRFHVVADQEGMSWYMIGRPRRQNEWLVSRGQTEADARLIAAAPDLLEELLSLVPLIEAEYPEQADVWLAGARRAIANAGVLS